MTIKEQKNEKFGLTTKEAEERQKIYGKNKLIEERKESFFRKIIDVLKEPMFLLLIGAAVIYFVLGEPRDGFIMLIFVVGIIAIDVIQEWKTDKTLKALKNLSQPQVTVIRDKREQVINSEDLVPGDIMIISEGDRIAADGKVIKCSDLAVNESLLTGESEVVWKTTYFRGGSKDYWKRNCCYAGSVVTQGAGAILVEKIGSETEYGKIGASIIEAPEIKTPMERETRKIVKVCTIIALVLFFLVCVITYINMPTYEFKERIISSILSGITLAMAMIPEEFPVILTVFLSMGAFRLAKKSSLVRKLPSVETLGAVSVLCVDKTGTITMNKMDINEIWTFKHKKEILIETMGLACEYEPYDPMEQGMLRYCKKEGFPEKKIFNGKLLKEYPFTSESKIMGHLWERNGEEVIASKGSPEKIISISNLDDNEKKVIEEEIYKMSSKGLRVIAIGKKVLREKEFPNSLEEIKLDFIGIVGLLDPPREGIKEDIESCVRAGVKVVMITGDNGVTASSIGRKIGMKNTDEVITGNDLDKMTDSELREKVKNVSIFSRVLPKQKMRIVQAFRDNGDIVAMTGDGVNDVVALKYADIGIAMGERGSDVCREAADLILLDDNFSTIVDTIKDGRRIYDNIKKAMGYIFTIHIPIAFASLLAPLLGIGGAMIFLLPLHVVLLEILIDPTCSVVLERQPAEDDIMERLPRNPKEGIINRKLLVKSVIQGIVLFIASFGAYYVSLKVNLNSVEVSRSIGLAIIMLSNLLLVQVNSSQNDFVYHSIKKLRKDPIMWLISLGTIIGIAIILYSPLAGILGLAALSMKQLIIVVLISFVSIMWYEVVKLINKLRFKESKAS